MKKILLNILICIWAIIAIITTISLLAMNDYRVTEIGDYSIIALVDDNLEPTYKKGSLMLIKNLKSDKINSNDDIFYYEANNQEALINYGTVISKNKVNENETTFVMQGTQNVSSEYVIGSTKETKTINNLGYVINVLQSQWGFMFIVIFPSIFLVIYEVYNIVVEVKKSNDKE